MAILGSLLTFEPERITIATVQLDKVILRGRVQFPTGGDYESISPRPVTAKCGDG